MNFLDVSTLWYSVKIMKAKIIFLLCCLIFLSGCREPDTPQKEKPTGPEQKEVQLQQKGCKSCHTSVTHDEHHDFDCVECHEGNAVSTNLNEAHANLVAHPAHPDFMVERCGKCHPDQVQSSRESLHFTLRNKVNLIRKHFGATDSLENLTEIPQLSSPATSQELVDDMLRRRCLRCHVYTSGDAYPLTQRGTGCAACHLHFIDGKLDSHEIIGLPGDDQCLSCHYANFVGADYYGRYENDFNWEYRTPYITHEEFIRAYGVEYHDLTPDIHQQKGLACVDCHSGHQLMTGEEKTKLSCSSCHQWNEESIQTLPDNVTIRNNKPVLTARLTGEQHTIPQLSHPAHKQYGNQVSCQVCHAQWSFNDSTTHLLRNDTDDFDSWDRLTVQSSSEVEQLLDHNLYSDEEERSPTMKDSITGKPVEGIWHKGFTQRRWEDMIIKRDKDGIIKVFRPILDLRLSFIDNNENVPFDNITGNGPVLHPYTPHTTGPAGMFYLNRFADIIHPRPAPSSPEK